ncbi:MAG: glycosyltransferase family 39 protein, partial [Dehalococcoidia bacterium]|nr:glycosyltransferase family 39 protein [Dehalococcoidia bacterium]
MATILGFVWAIERPPLLFPDATRYLFLARLIAEWTDYVPAATDGAATDHPPLLPATVAAVFKLTSTGVFAGMIATRIYGTAALALIAWTSARLFGGIAAPLAVLLVLGTGYFTPQLTQQVGVDVPQAALMVASLIALIAAVERPGWKLTVVAGTLLGASFLVKESAVMWLPLPLLLATGRRWESRRRAAAFAGTCYLAFAAVTGWWWVYVARVSDSVYLDELVQRGQSALRVGTDRPAVLVLIMLAAGTALLLRERIRRLELVQRLRLRRRSPMAATVTARLVLVSLAAGAGVAALVASSSAGVSGVVDYILNPIGLTREPEGLLERFPLAPLYGVAWAWTLYRAWRGALWAQVLSGVLLLTIPLVAEAAVSALAVRNLMAILLLSNVVLAGLVTRGLARITVHNLRVAASGAVIALAALPVAVTLADERLGLNVPTSGQEIAAQATADWLREANSDGRSVATSSAGNWLVRLYSPIDPSPRRVGYVATHTNDHRMSGVLKTSELAYIGGRLPGWDSVYIVLTEAGIFAEARAGGSDSLVWSGGDRLRTPLVLSNYWERVRDVDVLFRAPAVVAFSLEGIDPETARPWILTNSAVLRDLVGRPERFGGEDLFVTLAAK